MLNKSVRRDLTTEGKEKRDPWPKGIPSGILHPILWVIRLGWCSLREARGPVDVEATTCQQLDGTQDRRWEGDFPWSDKAHHLLRDFFGSRDFRLNQRQALNATLSGLDCFVLMPTGGGDLLLE